MQERKTRNKFLLPMIISLIACCAVIVGATLAIFVSEETIPGEIDAAQVSVTHAVDKDTLNLYSYVLKNGQYKQELCTDKFAAGGSARINNDGRVIIENMAKGDKIEFEVAITNSSTIDVKWQPFIKFDEQTDKEFFSQLKITFAVEGGQTVTSHKVHGQQNGDVRGYWTFSKKQSQPQSQKVTITVELPWDSTWEPSQVASTNYGFDLGVSAVQSNAYTDAENTNALAFEKTTIDGVDGYAVTGVGTLQDQSVIYIPEWHQGADDEKPLPVLFVANEAFRDNSNIKVVCFAEDTGMFVDKDGKSYGGVKSIGASAFYRCGGLEEVCLPNSLTQIWGGAFQGTALKSVTIPQSVNELGYEVFENGSTTICGVFEGCKSLASVTFEGNCLTSIPDRAFYNCESLENVELPSGVTAIGERAFYNCSKLQSIELPSSLTSIGIRAFQNCRQLQSVELPAGVTSIGTSAFSLCESLQSVELPAGLTTIGESAFYNCESLQSVELPAGLTTIGESAFYNCKTLQSVYLAPGTATVGENGSIGDNAFYGCNALQSVEIPSGVTSIGYGAFNSCSSLQTVVFPQNIQSIGELAFYKCVGLTTVEINSPALTSIGNSAFQGCSSLTTVEINSPVLATIGESAFFQCYGLTTLEINSSVITTIGEGAFRTNAKSITKLVAPINVIDALKASSAVISVFLTNTVTDLTILPSPNNTAIPGSSDSTTGYWGNSQVLKSLTIGSGITAVGDYAFYGCENLTSFTIQEGSTSLASFGVGAFKYCRNIPSIDLTNTSPNGFTLSESVFEICNELTNIVLPQTVTSIPAKAFRFCERMVALDLSHLTNLSSIGSQAFADCQYYLETLILPSTVTTCADDAFLGSYALREVTAPASVAFALPKSYAGTTGDSNPVQKLTINGGTISAGQMGLYNVLQELTVLNAVSVDANASNTFTGTRFPTIEKVNWYANAIPDYAFKNVTSLQEVFVAKECTSIRIDAFAGCSSLSTFTLEEDSRLSYIGWSVFAETAITNLDLSNATAEPFTLESHAFDGMKKLTSIVLPKGIKKLPSSAFMECTSLKSLDLSQYTNADFTLGNSVFYKMASLTSIVLPQGVTKIPRTAFYDCTSLQTLDLSYLNITLIDERAFHDCTSLETIVLPDTVRTIEMQAFYGCESLQTLVIPDTVTSIGDYAFYECSSLQTLVIPDTVTSIGDYAFKYCTGLQSIVLPKTLQTIGHFAIANCTSLTDLTCSAEVAAILPKYPNDDGSSVTANITKLTINGGTIPETQTVYSNFNYKSLTEVYVLSGVNVAEGAIYTFSYDNFDYHRLETVHWLTSAAIPERAFYLLQTLETVYLSNECVGIDQAAFFSCPKLTTVTVLNTANAPVENFSIGTQAFESCGNLKTLELPAAKTSSCANNAFSGCASLATVTCPAEIAFALPISYGNTNSTVTTITINSGTLPIFTNDQSTIAYTALETLTVLEGVGVADGDIMTYNATFDGWGMKTVNWYASTIPANAFRNSSVQTVNIYKECTTIGAAAFQGSDLTTFTLEEGSQLTSVGEYAWYSCQNLQTIDFGNAKLLKSFGLGAFTNCASLTTCILPPNLAEISEAMFVSCEALESLSIPASVKTVKKSAFAFAFADGGTLTFEGNSRIVFETTTESQQQVFYHTGLVRIFWNNATWGVVDDSICQYQSTGTLFAGNDHNITVHYDDGNANHTIYP